VHLSASRERHANQGSVFLLILLRLATINCEITVCTAPTTWSILALCRNKSLNLSGEGIDQSSCTHTLARFRALRQ
jgi:hypothetical protein